MIEKEVNFNNVYVYAASKRKEKITESPAAISTLTKTEIYNKSRTGKLAELFQGSVGIDILQNGANDFIVNTRGFNGGLNRRVLVLQDGRDVAMPLLGAQEWNSFALSADEFSRIEFVRGPAAALYGANAFNGVLNLVSPAPKEVLGTKVSFLSGDYNTFKGDIQNAGELGQFSYKINLGHSQVLNYSKRRDSLQFLEYSGLALERKELTNADRQTFANYGNLRLDYDFDDSHKITGEAGYSRSGNETFVFGLGRTFVKDVERPYVRFAYNSDRINVNTYFMQRRVLDTMWLLVPNAPLLDNSKDFMIDFQHNFDLFGNLKFIWGVSEQLQYIRTSGTSIPFDVDANYTGLYGQIEWQINPDLKLVSSGRIDYASIHPTQFSPRLALVMSLSDNHKLRLSVGRAFQRPNYSELYRLTPDAPAFSPATHRPIKFEQIQEQIADSILALSGTKPELNLNLNAFNAKAIGNDKLDVEKIISLELGYQGIFGSSFYINSNIYYNRLNDFITNFLPGINPAIKKWHPDLQGDLAQYNDLVEQMVISSLSPRDQERLSILNGKPTFVVSNANVGKVDEYGLELELIYYLTENFKINANYSYYGYNVIQSNISQPIVPNTSPNRINLSASYLKEKSYDMSLSVRYSEGFDWLAGTYIGYVPSYTIVNLNGGVYLTNSLRLGVNVYNLLNKQFYQVFGGTYLPRYTTARLSYDF